MGFKASFLKHPVSRWQGNIVSARAESMQTKMFACRYQTGSLNNNGLKKPPAGAPCEHETVVSQIINLFCYYKYKS